MPDKHLILIEHLEELRKRLIKSIIFIAICYFILYRYVDVLLSIIIKLVGKVVFIAPQEAFVANLKIALLAGLFIASPFLIYQIWRFISVGLQPNEKKCILFFGPLSFILFVLGIIFGCFIMVPVGIKFLLAYSSELVIPMISVDKYISFVGGLTLVFGLIEAQKSPVFKLGDGRQEYWRIRLSFCGGNAQRLFRRVLGNYHKENFPTYYESESSRKLRALARRDSFFELPLVILFLTKIGLVSPVFLIKRWRESIVVIFIVAAFLTPPDVINQLLMAVPLMILYLVSIIFSKFAFRQKETIG